MIVLTANEKTEQYDYLKNKYGIYCITCKTNGKKYIGQTSESFYRRWTLHIWQLRNNRHDNKYLQNSWNKYGEDNFDFSITEEFNNCQKNTIDKKKLNELEIYWIHHYDTFKNGFNMTTGGNSSKGFKMPDEAKRKIGEKK